MIRNVLSKCSEYPFATIVEKTFFQAKSAPRGVKKQLNSEKTMPELCFLCRHPLFPKHFYAHCLHYFEYHQNQATQVIFRPIPTGTSVEHAFSHFYVPTQKPLELSANKNIS